MLLHVGMQAVPEGNRPDACNDMLPNESTYHRFLWVIQVRDSDLAMQLGPIMACMDKHACLVAIALLVSVPSSVL